MDWLRRLFSSEFLPHGHCYFWRSDILWLNVGSDFLIVLAYWSIPVALFHFLRRRRDVAFGWLFGMFGAFILLCGATHALEIWTVWRGTYGVQGVVKLLTAGVSVATALVLWPVLPKAIALARPGELEAANRELRRVQNELEARVQERTSALEEANRALRREVRERDRAEQRFRLAVESSPSGMVMVDARGTIVLVNRAAEAIFGYEREELIGSPVEMLVPGRFRGAHPGHRAGFVADPRTRSMGAGRDLFAVHKDGREVPVEIGLNPIRMEDGLFVLGAVVDITERKRAERVLEAKTQELERSNRELDEFAHVVSHDLKAPLRGISSLVAWIREDCGDSLPAASREHLELLGQRSRRMSELIDGILRYSEIGRQRSSLEWIDTRDVVQQTCDSLDPPDGIRIRIEGTLPVLVYDRTRLHQVFQNLIGNAVEHLGRPQGEIVVACREGPAAFEFRVSDDGVGIDERHFARIFKIFQALERDPDKTRPGIGLSIVKKIVETHGGRVWVESRPGAGSTFGFTVPKEGGEERDGSAHRPLA
jgi:PAS domain S-box-containing protein